MVFNFKTAPQAFLLCFVCWLVLSRLEEQPKVKGAVALLLQYSDLVSAVCFYCYSSIGRRRTWRRRTARLEFLGNLRTSQAGILELRTILKITVNNSHAPHRTQDLLRVVDWQPNACTHLFDLGSCVADFRSTIIVKIRTKRLE